MSSRLCRDCGNPGAIATRAPEHLEILVVEDPYVVCRTCGREWIAAGARFVLGDPPPPDEPGADEWFKRYTAATRAGDGGAVALSVEEFERRGER